MHTAKTIFAELDAEGRIRRLNRHGTEVLGEHLEGTRFLDRIIDFQDAVHLEALTASPDEEHLLTIATTSGEPCSYLFTFVTDGDGALVFGRADTEDLALMSHEIYALNRDLANLSRELHKKNALLTNALSHIKKLQGIIPICMHCHKIRNEQELWDKLESYIERHTDAKFSHSICSECLDKYYPVTRDDEDDEDDEAQLE